MWSVTKKTAPIEISKNLEKKIQRACLSDEPLPCQQNKFYFCFLLCALKMKKGETYLGSKNSGSKTSPTRGGRGYKMKILKAKSKCSQ